MPPHGIVHGDLWVRKFYVLEDKGTIQAVRSHGQAKFGCKKCDHQHS